MRKKKIVLILKDKFSEISNKKLNIINNRRSYNMVMITYKDIKEV